MQKIDPQLIGFDIDGVVADTASSFLHLAKEIHGINTFRLEDITEFDVAKCLPIPAEIVDGIFNILLENPIDADLQPMPHAVSVLSELSEKAPLTFITARPHKKPIEDWLRHVLGEKIYKKSKLIAMGDHDGKYNYIMKMGLDYFVDDRAETCIDLDRLGLTPLVYEQPWNQGRHQLQTVDSWLTIRELCS